MREIRYEKLPLAELRSLFRSALVRPKELFNRAGVEVSSTEACLGCGTCTFVCPTCQCYDIQEFNNGHGGAAASAAGTSCMYSDFTKMSAGQPRPDTAGAAFRQRFMHKLVYYPDNTRGYCSAASAAADACKSARST